MGRRALNGMVAGLAGTIAMTASEKVEQAITRRPNSYIPPRTLERFLLRPTKPDEAVSETKHDGTAHRGTERGKHDRQFDDERP